VEGLGGGGSGGGGATIDEDGKTDRAGEDEGGEEGEGARGEEAEEADVGEGAGDTDGSTAASICSKQQIAGAAKGLCGVPHG
jgi:hypothetical protein